MEQVRELSGRPRGYEAVSPVPDDRLDYLPEPLLVDLVVPGEGGDW